MARNNSPDTIVYNQCSNEMLRYAVDVCNEVDDDVPMSLEGDELDHPPQPGDIDVIIAGFPWCVSSNYSDVSHSRLQSASLDP